MAVAAALVVHVTAMVGAELSWVRTVATAAVGPFAACTVSLALGPTWSTALEITSRTG